LNSLEQVQKSVGDHGESYDASVTIVRCVLRYKRRSGEVRGCARADSERTKR